MKPILAAALICGCALLQTPAQTVGLSGTVTNKANGQKLPGVVVELAKAGLADTTDSLGRYSLGTATGLLYAYAPHNARVRIGLHRNTLRLDLRSPAKLRLSLFASDGKSLASLFSGQAAAGAVSIPLPEAAQGNRMLWLRVEAGAERSVYKLVRAGKDAELVPAGKANAGDEAALPAGSFTGSSNGSFSANESGARTLVKAAAVMDTLRVRRTGYKTSETPLDTYSGVHDVALEPEGTGCVAGVICWDFEEGRLPDGWTAYRNEFTGSILVDGTKPHKGSFALHAKDLVGGKEGSQGGPKKSIKYTLPANFGPVLWGRAYVWTTPARPESHAGLFNARYPRPGAASTAAVNTLDWYELATYKQTYMTIWHPPEPPGFPEWVLHSDKPLVLDNWACLEWVFDAANGSAPEAADPRMWVDGTELSWPDKFVFSDPAGKPKAFQEKAKDFTFLETGVYLYQGLTQVTNWWIDDLAVGSRRIGCQ